MISSLQELNDKMLACKDCGLCGDRKQVVLGTGNSKAKLMLIGEGPGEDEDIQGIPFVGKAGQKLDSILKFIGVNRQDIYISNSVLCRPPNNRKPTYEEMSACRWRLEKEIELIDPVAIIALGKTALEQLAGKPIKGALKHFFPILNPDKGCEWLLFTLGNKSRKVMITYHPSYLLRSPEQGYKTVLPHWTMIKNWIANGSN
jgi:uracil-DNA glycosylase